MTPVAAVLRVSIMLAAALGLEVALRRRSAALRHWVLAVGILGAAVAPALSPIAPSWRVPFGAHHALAPAADSAPAHAMAPTSVSVAIALTPPTAPVRRGTPPTAATLALWVWAIGSAFVLLALGAGLARLRWIAGQAQSLADPEWTAARDAIAAELGVSRRVALLESDAGLLVTWGVRAPTILVPRSAVGWSRDRIRIVLAHEIAHIARGDWAIQLLAEIVCAAHWFNPIAWLACRRLRQESEHACDDTVLRLGADGSEYASHLLELARSMTMRRRAWVPAQAMLRPSSFERRVTAMLNRHLDRSPLSRAGRLTAVAAIAAVTLLVAGYSWAQGLTVLGGTVSDQLGAPIANLPLVLTDSTTGAKHEVQSDQSGHYQFVALPAGDYALTSGGIPGFARLQEQIALGGDALQHNVTLKLGTVQETLTITDGPPPPVRPAPDREQLQRRIRERATRTCGGAGGCVAPPIKLTDKKPAFPDSQKDAGGIVTLKATIDTTGHVSNIRVVGDANPDLAQAATAAVSQWEFDPTRLDGVVVDTAMTVSVMFKPAR